MNLNELRQQMHTKALLIRRLDRLISRQNFDVIWKSLNDADKKKIKKFLRDSDEDGLTKFIEENCELETESLRRLRKQGKRLNIYNYSRLNWNQLYAEIRRSLGLDSTNKPTEPDHD